MYSEFSFLVETARVIPPGRGGGGTPGNSWWGCATQFFKS